MATRSKPKGERIKPTGRPRVTVVSPPKPGVEYETIELTRQHGINEQTFGPGRVRVRRDIALILLQNEQNLKRAQLRMFQPRTHVISGNGHLIQVPPDFFDDPASWTRMPVLRQDGRFA